MKLIKSIQDMEKELESMGGNVEAFRKDVQIAEVVKDNVEDLAGMFTDIYEKILKIDGKKLNEDQWWAIHAKITDRLFADYECAIARHRSQSTGEILLNLEGDDIKKTERIVMYCRHSVTMADLLLNNFDSVYGYTIQDLYWKDNNDPEWHLKPDSDSLPDDLFIKEVK